MTINEILERLTEGTTLEGPLWTEPVRVLTAKVRGSKIEVQAVGINTRRLWTKLVTAEQFDGPIKVSVAGQLAALDGNSTHFRLAAEAHRIRLAFQYDPHFAVSVSQVDPLPHQMDAVYTHLLTQPRIRFLIADDPGAGKTIMAGLTIKELKFRGLIERTLIITPANLGAAAVRGELIKHTGWGGTGHSVIDSDIAGKNAKAPEIDRQLGSEYAKESVSEKLAKATFMYSFSGSQQRGATLPQLRVAVLNPEMAPPFVSDALDRMTKRLWYMYHDSGLYRFESRPNLNRILVDREEMVRSEPDKVRDFAKQTLNDMIGDVAFRVYRYPEEDRDVADEPRLSLVVLDLDQGATEEGPTADTEKFVTQVLKQHGKGFRKHANVLIFLAPDQARSSEVIDAARRLLALRNIEEDKGTKKQLTEEQLKDLAGRLKEAEARLPAALATVCRFVLVPAKNKTLRCFDLGITGYPDVVKIDIELPVTELGNEPIRIALAPYEAHQGGGWPLRWKHREAANDQMV